MTLCHLVLASASPRRRMLLEQAGISYRVVPPRLEESEVRHADPAALAGLLAVAKARDVEVRLSGAPDGWILGADTIVACDGTVLDKPADRADAARMIGLLSGRTHEVVTAVAVLPAPGASPAVGCDRTFVTFDRLAPDEIDWYLDSADWEGVAGGYRIQGLAARYVSRVEGSWSTVAGLPLHLLYSILRQHDWPGLGQHIPSPPGAERR